MHRSIQITVAALILSLLVPALAQVLGADPLLAWILGGTAALVCLIVGEFTGEILIWAWIGVGLGAFLGAVMYLVARSTYQKRLGTQGEIYIGPMGLLNGSAYTSFGGFGTRLTGVELEEGDPSAIRFEITSSGGSSETTNSVRVPVPRGHEAEAVQVVARFHGQA